MEANLRPVFLLNTMCYYTNQCDILRLVDAMRHKMNWNVWLRFSALGGMDCLTCYWRGLDVSK